MKVVFLDRDGVINQFPGNGNYVTSLSRFRFIPGSLEAIEKLNRLGCEVFVISNQAGVSKGLFTQETLNEITATMLDGVANSGGRIRKVFYSIKPSNAGCEYRKPNIGSIKAAMDVLGKPVSDAKNGFFVGDTESDIQAGHNAGCRTIHVLSGRENLDYVERKWETRPDFVVKNLFAAVEIIERVYRREGVLTDGAPLKKSS